MSILGYLFIGFIALVGFAAAYVNNPKHNKK